MGRGQAYKYGRQFVALSHDTADMTAYRLAVLAMGPFHMVEAKRIDTKWIVNQNADMDNTFVVMTTEDLKEYQVDVKYVFRTYRVPNNCK
jgi:hypothetical protein